MFDVATQSVSKESCCPHKSKTTTVPNQRIVFVSRPTCCISEWIIVLQPAERGVFVIYAPSNFVGYFDVKNAENASHSLGPDVSSPISRPADKLVAINEEASDLQEG